MQVKFEALWRVTLTTDEGTAVILVKIEQMDQVARLLYDAAAEMERLLPKREDDDKP